MSATLPPGIIFPKLEKLWCACGGLRISGGISSVCHVCLTVGGDRASTENGVRRGVCLGEVNSRFVEKSSEVLSKVRLENGESESNPELFQPALAVYVLTL